MTIRCRDDTEAEALAASLAPENDGYVHVERHGSTLTFRIDATSPGSALRTLDDLVRCVQAFHGIEEREQR